MLCYRINQNVHIYNFESSMYIKSSKSYFLKHLKYFRTFEIKFHF